MKSMWTEDGKGGVHLDLTKPFVIWMVLFTCIAVLLKSWALFFIALIPVFFTAVFILIALGVVGVWYMSGKPITVNTPRKGSRVVQRKK